MLSSSLQEVKTKKFHQALYEITLSIVLLVYFFSQSLRRVRDIPDSSKEIGIKCCWNRHSLLSHISSCSWSHDNDCQHNCPFCRNSFYFVFMTNCEHFSTLRSLEGRPHLLKMPKLSFPPLHLNYTFNKSWIVENYLHISESLEGICQEHKIKEVFNHKLEMVICAARKWKFESN